MRAEGGCGGLRRRNAELGSMSNELLDGGLERVVGDQQFMGQLQVREWGGGFRLQPFLDRRPRRN